MTATAAALTTEARKHEENNPKCAELGWVCIPVVAESYGAWGKEATQLFSTNCHPKQSVTLNDIYCRLNLQLVRANATAMDPGSDNAPILLIYCMSGRKC